MSPQPPEPQLRRDLGFILQPQSPSRESSGQEGAGEAPSPIPRAIAPAAAAGDNFNESAGADEEFMGC